MSKAKMDNFEMMEKLSIISSSYWGMDLSGRLRGDRGGDAYLRTRGGGAYDLMAIASASAVTGVILTFARETEEHGDRDRG